MSDIIDITPYEDGPDKDEKDPIVKTEIHITMSEKPKLNIRHEVDIVGLLSAFLKAVGKS
jgi:hypothetical protein